MCIFPEGRLITPHLQRVAAVKNALKNEKLLRPTPNDIVRLLGLTKENQQEKVAKFCNSLWKMPYEDQLRFKENRAMERMRRLSEIVQENVAAPIVNSETGLFRTLSMYPIVPSPKITAYRGKDGFMVNIGIDGDPATVGMPYGSQRLSMSIPPREAVVTSKPIHKILCELFQQYLRRADTPAGLVAPTYFDPGGYKFIFMRSSRREDKLMVTVEFDRRRFKQHRIEEEKERLIDYFLGDHLAELPESSRVSSLYFRQVQRIFTKQEDALFEHLGGEMWIEETVLGKTFRISPSTFFQINVDCAEVLFRNVIEQCPLDKDKTVLLDVGCGCGVYSIVLSSHVKHAIGIDLNSQSINDAENNAQLNGVENAKFVVGRLESMTADFFDQLTKKEEGLVAIVNPGRWGVMAETITALRRLSGLKTLIYVSCYPYEVAFCNFVNLLKPPDGQYTGKPFTLTKAIPVDMFPNTPHYELVLLFER